jgi:virulence factor
MKNVRVGVVGVGTMGERHCRVYSSLRHADLVGVADLNATLGQAVASNYDTKYFKDYEQLLAELDAISVVTTTPSHFKLAMAAIERGIHALVEKPMTETVEQSKQLVEVAERYQRVLQVGHIERFNPVYTELKNVLSGMRLVAINVRRLSPFDISNTDVDVIRDLMIHDLDLIINMVGHDFENLNAWGRSISTNAIDHAVANFSFRDGPIVTLTASRVTEQKVRVIEVIAEGAYIEADLLSKNLMIHRRTFPQYVGHNAGKYRQESVIERIHVPMVEPLMLQLRHFMECVRDGKPSSVPGRDGLHSLQLAQTITELISQSSPAKHNLSYVNGSRSKIRV